MTFKAIYVRQTENYFVVKLAEDESYEKFTKALLKSLGETTCEIDLQAGFISYLEIYPDVEDSIRRRLNVIFKNHKCKLSVNGCCTLFHFLRHNYGLFDAIIRSSKVLIELCHHGDVHIHPKREEIKTIVKQLITVR